MDAKFWISAWDEGRTGFHRGAFNERLLDNFPALNPQKGQSILVPLCGKTKDLLWLHSLGLKIHGIELYAKAVEEFFTDNHLPVTKGQDENFANYSYENILLSAGDFFKLSDKNTYDFIYDRAALVALPETMRKDYAQVIKRSLKKGGKCLLVVYEYDQAQMSGPPFSISENEVQSLYADQFSIKLVDTVSPDREGPKFSSLESLKEKVYILEKVR